MSFGIVVVIYTSLAFMGAKMFGPEVSSQVTLSMPKNLIFTKIALWATALTPMTKYVFVIGPLASEVERKLPSSMSLKIRMFIRGIAGSLFLIFVLILALVVPYFERVLGLTGSLVSVAISFVLPLSFYIKIFWSQITKRSLVLHLIIITICSILGIFGTISTIKSLIETL